MSIEKNKNYSNYSLMKNIMLYGIIGTIIYNKMLKASSSPDEEKQFTKRTQTATAAVGIVTFAIAAAVTGVLDIFGVLTAIVPYVGSLYPGVAFQVIFGLWFGIYGAIGSYIGPLFAGLFEGLSFAAALVQKFGDFMQSLIPFLAFRYLNGNPALKSKRDWLLYMLFAFLINNLIGGLIGAFSVWYFFHVPARIMFTIGYATWVVSNWIVVLVIGIPVLKIVTPYVEKTRLYLLK
ncbi:MAG: hypothetical protein RXR51_05880 [Nitrososphaeria archaeon]